MNNNTKVFQNLNQQSGFDVVVIGGGINGISVFRELALQGVKVLLVEKEIKTLDKRHWIIFYIKQMSFMRSNAKLPTSQSSMERHYIFIPVQP